MKYFSRTFAPFLGTTASASPGSPATRIPPSGSATLASTSTNATWELTPVIRHLALGTRYHSLKTFMVEHDVQRRFFSSLRCFNTPGGYECKCFEDQGGCSKGKKPCVMRITEVNCPPSQVSFFAIR